MTIYLSVEIFKGRCRYDQHNGHYSHDAAARAAAAGGPHRRRVTTITLNVKWQVPIDAVRTNKKSQPDRYNSDNNLFIIIIILVMYNIIMCAADRTI